MNIRKKDSTAILNALYGGVVPNRGLEYIIVGRKEESRQILADLESVKEGASIIKLFIGPYGSGKTFIQALIKQIAYRQKFVVAQADFAPDRRLYGSERKAVSTYNELMKNLSIATVQDGNALPTILEKWISEVQAKVAQSKGYQSVSYDDPAFVKDIKNEIYETVTKMDELTGGFDFAQVIIRYFEGFIQDDSYLQRSALRWLRGEYQTKTEARQDLGVRSSIDDNNYYEYIKVMAHFVRQIGYSGLVVNLDEAINLYKIDHKQSREKNFEVILKIFNDTLQGSLGGLYITIGGTPEFLEDERRGLFSYPALKSRLVTNRFETSAFRDLSQPVIKLSPLKADELFVLLDKIKAIHAVHYGYQSNVTDKEIEGFIRKAYSRPGADENLTAREIVRDFIAVLNILYQNPVFNREEAFGAPVQTSEQKQRETADKFSRFQRMGG
ncbi:ATP-binding protein [Thermoflavimicrobium dichotomicum]|uniref:Biotin carboxylase n=1 Tax=Thermoflavimicrobium dichotomicum TaxID=46223 RepID=A0A1I3MSJ2_9BACL|nr:ATP-binding protein [Thermoflavimicrobium dichotomicum]SFI99666.1 P-loop protein of unknown function [Thermoflavimicrobium dichotomicum]